MGGPTILDVIAAEMTKDVDREGVTTARVDIGQDNTAVMRKYLILSPIITVFWVFVMVGVVIYCTYSSDRRNRNRLNRRNVLENCSERNQDNPPSYNRVFFFEDPPCYEDIISEDVEEDVPLIDA